mgnify:FL=1
MFLRSFFLFKQIKLSTQNMINSILSHFKFSGCCATSCVNEGRENEIALNHSQRSEHNIQTGTYNKIPRPTREHKIFSAHPIEIGLKGTSKKDSLTTSANSSFHGPAPENAVKISKMPNYITPAIQKIIDSLKPFEYEYDSPEDKTLPLLEPYEVEEGAIYIGQWKNGKKHGRGEQIWPDGTYHKGYWRNGVAKGKGRLIHANGNVYEGDWHTDKAHGFGVFARTDGSLYEGEWFEDFQHGYGKESWLDGSQYEGNYYMGTKHGNGKFLWGDGSKYEGEFQQNELHGQGVYEWPDKCTYNGEWKYSKMDGRGTFTWPDGRKYVGEYVQDKKQGFGVFYWPDGTIYKGYWEDGKQHGVGSLFNPEGVERKGQWSKGKRIKWLDQRESANVMVEVNPKE